MLWTLPSKLSDFIACVFVLQGGVVDEREKEKEGRGKKKGKESRN